MSMVTKFLTTTAAKVNTIPVVNGQIIALSDRPGWYYDMGNTRHSVTGDVIDTSLPARGETDTLYVINSATEGVSGVYIWSGTEFVKICGLDNEKVQTSTSSATRVYLVGSTSNAAGSETLVKNVGVYVDMSTGEFSGTANAAVNDDNNQEIKTTYIKNVSAAKSGETVTFTVTKGDDTTSTFTVQDSDTTYEIFEGSTASDDGESGLVPKPTSADRVKFLRGDGTWAEVEATDTKNTAGATDSDSKLYIVGATEQTANPQTYSNDQAYGGSDGHVYSDGKQVVNLSGSQALTNKTYEGYTLGNASEKTVASEIAEDGLDLPTAGQVYDALQSILSDAKSYTDTAIGSVDSFDIEVVSELPASGQKEHTIYLVPNSGTGTNVKDEYLWINSNWEKIGTTDIDLSGYAKATDLANKGSATQPVYFDANGDPVAITYTIAKSVPADAKFTDTTYTQGTGITISASNEISNSGVRSVAEGSIDGTVSVNTNGTTQDVPVHGLGSAAFADTTDFLGANASAKSAAKLDDANVGSATKGVYIGADGKPAVMTYSVEKDVPSDAVFTDTTYNIFDGATSSTQGSSGLVPQPSAGDEDKFLAGDGTWKINSVPDLGLSVVNGKLSITYEQE